MPNIRPDAILLSILVLCIPLQNLLVQYWGHSEIGRTHAINEFITSLIRFKSQYLEWESWKKWSSILMAKYLENSPSPGILYQMDFDDPYGESPAAEVMQYKQKEGYFTVSPEPRDIRSPQVQLRVGQVVIHKFSRYRGVIIGWDEKAKAPEKWLKAMHGKDKQRWKNMPNYAVLVDVRDRLIPQITYVPQENLIPMKSTKIVHPLIDDHFEKFDGAQYIPRPWLRTMYPMD